MNLRATALVVAAVTSLLVWPVLGEPKPSEIPVSWELGFRYPDPPQAIQVHIPGKGAPRLFWYFRYSVTNRTGKDQVFVPDFSMYTDTGKLTEAGKGVHSVVFDAIKRLHNDVFLRDTTAMTGKLLQGEDNTKGGVAIWRDFDPQAGAFDIFVGGLSGEAAEIILPKPVQVSEIDVKTGDRHTVTKKKLVVTKTLRLHYSVPGEAAARAFTPATSIRKDWVMR